MSPNPAPSTWSPHWRSLHPACTDEEILDALHPFLQQKFAAHFENRAITSLHLFKQGHPYFRLPSGELCHWAQTTKTASLSIEAAIGAHMPSLWAGPHKQYDLPNGQKAAKSLVVFVEKPLFSDILKVPAAKFLFVIPRRSYRLRMDTKTVDPKWSIILCNAASPNHKPPGFHALRIEKFRPRPHAKIRFCVLRDPVDRFISAIAYLKPQPRPAKHKSPQKILEKHITKLETAGSRLDVHLAPQTDFIGREPAYYTHIFRMGEWQRLEHFLSEWIGAPVQLPHLNQSQREPYAVLTPAQKHRVEAFYAEDYKIWGRYF